MKFHHGMSFVLGQVRPCGQSSYVVYTF